MKYAPIVYVAAAIGYEIYCKANTPDEEDWDYPATQDEFVQWFGQRFSGSIDREDAAAAIGVLHQAGLITFDEDEFAGRFLTADVAEFYSRWRDLVKEAPDSPFAKGHEFGSIWFKAVFENGDFWDTFRASDPQLATYVLPSNLLGAPEPVIFIVEDSADAKEIAAGLENLSEELRTNNEIANELGDDRARIAAEVEASRELLRPGAVRKSAVREVLIKVLREIARKLKDKAVALGVDRLIELAVKLVDF